MKILLFAPVLRQGSYNKKLIRLVHQYLQKSQDHDLELVEFNEFPMPMFDGDIESEKGIPESVSRLGRKISEAEAVIISSPEYNGSIPGTFKNAIDWISRLKPVPLENKHICLIGASQGYFAGMRGTLHTRVPLQILKAHVYPDYFGVAKSQEVFDKDGQIQDLIQLQRLHSLIDNFLSYVSQKVSTFDRLGEFLDEQNNQSNHHH